MKRYSKICSRSTWSDLAEIVAKVELLTTRRKEQSAARQTEREARAVGGAWEVADR